MFRKPKRKAKQGLRRKDSDEEHLGGTNVDDEEEDETSELLSEARKRVKTTTAKGVASAAATTAQSSSILHSYETAKEARVTNSDLATSTAEHHPEALLRRSDGDTSTGTGSDGIFRDKQRSKLLAGPLKKAANVRTTVRFDYEPNICKDYKETGHCGFGDTCIYLHDRGDTMTGWQLEQQWEEQQRKKKEQQEKEIQGFVDKMTDGGKGEGTSDMISAADGLPFACHLCREHFKSPVVTTCNHYFCESCIMDHVRAGNENCPICSKDMGAVFNQPTKLIAKKRKILGAAKAKAEDSWEEYAKAFAERNNPDA